MGEYLIELPSETLKFEFKGDEPTAEEKFKIASIIRNRKSGKAPLSGSSSAEPEQMFDTESGIKDAKLRALLSAAETPGDEEAQLKKLYGMTETDYTRDNRGRLAITPEGGKKLGLELTQPTLIDESGFSRYDFADMAAIVPEIGAAVYGGIKGAALGTAVAPGLGTFIGGALGAGLGAGSTQAIEESIEALAGVQTQTAEEVAQDVKSDFVTGLLTDATFGAFGLLGRGVTSATRAGRGLTKEELEVAGESMEMGIFPTLSSIRAPSLLSRQQGIAEKVLGSSTRLKQNNDVMQNKLAEFRKDFEDVSSGEAGSILTEGVSAQQKRLLAKEEELQRAILQNLRGVGETMGAAAEKNMNLEDDVFNILVGARNSFDEEMTRAFKPIDEALESAFGSEKIFNIGNLRETINGIPASVGRPAAEGLREFEAAALAGGTKPNLSAAIDVIKSLGKDKASFTQLYKARKTLNDILSRSVKDEERGQIGDLISKIDMKLSANNVDTVLESLGEAVPANAAKILMNASKAIEPARDMYAKGIKIFEDIESAGVIKNLARKAANGESIGVKDVALDKIIKKDDPKTLARTLRAVEYGLPEEAKKGASEEFRKKISGQWLNDALTSSGLTKANDFDPSAFKAGAFAKSIRDLGRTADVLFGADAGRIKKLADDIEKTSISNMKQADVDRLVANLPEGANMKDTLEALVAAQRSVHDNMKNRVFKKLSDGSLESAPIEAAELIANSSTTASEIKQILNAFEGNEEALKKIQGNYMERLIADFGSTLTTDGKTLKAFATRLMDADKGGKLQAIFGEKMGKDMAQFAKILEFNAKTTPGGDLVAANIAASPLENLGVLAKLSLMGRFFTSAPHYDQILKDYKRLKGEDVKPKELGKSIAKAMGMLVAQGATQSAQEGAREAEQQLRAVADSSGLGQQIQNLSSQVQAQIPNNSTAMPPQPVQPAPAAPNNLRQQAAQSPGVAQALGIRGATAGLLGNP